MADAPEDDEEAREQAIVDEVVSALRGEPSTAADHPRDRRRVRTVIEAIEAAR